MADIFIVDIDELNATTSVLKTILIPVEVPGQGIKKLTKEALFNLSAQVLNYITTAGPNSLITIDGSDYGFRYIDAGSSSQIQARFPKFYFTSTSSSTGIYVDTANDILACTGILGTGNFHMNLGGNLLSMTLDANFSTDTSAYLGTSLDQQLYYNAALSNATGVSAKNCQRSIMKIATASPTNASNQVNFPTTPKDGYTFELTVKGTITALTCTPDGGSTIEDAPSTATNESFKWAYNLANTVWVKIF